MQLKTALQIAILLILTSIAGFVILGGCQALHGQEKEAPEKKKVITKTKDDKGVTEYRVDDAVLKAIREKNAEPKEKRLHEMTLIEYKLWINQHLDDFRGRIKEIPAATKRYELARTGLLRSSHIDSFSSPTLVGYVLDVPQVVEDIGPTNVVTKDRELYFLAASSDKMIDTWRHMLKIEGHEPKVSLKGYVVRTGGTAAPSIFVVESMTLAEFVRR